LHNKQQSQDKQIVVLKIGSSSISGSDGRIKLSILSIFTEMVCDLTREGYHVIIVSSGAVSVGCNRLGLKERPKDIVTKQACSAVGQGRLMRMYDDLFSLLGQPIAQVLLSRENLSQEHHYLNAMNTFQCLMDMGVVAIVNENDTVAVQELRFGDNDNLSALVASVVRAQWLFLLTDVDALYTSNPRTDPNAKAIHVVEDISQLMVDTATGSGPASGQWGTGGMATKLQAASVACSSGCRVCVVSTDHLEHVRMILKGSTSVGTTFFPSARTIAGRKKWIAYGLVPVGSLFLDAGATRAIANKTSLFAAGVVKIEGDFPANSAVRILNKDGKEIGRGISNYSSDEIEKIMGKPSSQYAEMLGYHGPSCVIERGNLAVYPSAMTPSASFNNLAAMMIEPSQGMMVAAEAKSGADHAESNTLSPPFGMLPSPGSLALPGANSTTPVSPYGAFDFPAGVDMYGTPDGTPLPIPAAATHASGDSGHATKFANIGFDTAVYGEPELDEDDDACDGADA